jgi:hypothetical protein
LFWGWATGLDHCKRVGLFDGYREHCRPSIKWISRHHAWLLLDKRNRT